MKTQPSRRVFLRGAGVTMALPWLESMPVWGATTEAPKRFGVVFMGNGINGNHWWSKGNGDEMKLSTSLEPLAFTCFSNSTAPRLTFFRCLE